jgi:hypothetical protein
MSQHGCLGSTIEVSSISTLALGFGRGDRTLTHWRRRRLKIYEAMVAKIPVGRRASTIAEGVVACEIRKRSARLQVLQNTLDRMRNLFEARAIEYAHHLGGATGMLVKDYRGKNAEQEIWKFNGSLVAQINDVLKQAAIEEGQWTEKRDAKGSVGISVMMERLNAGRQRVADAKAKRDVVAAQSGGHAADTA